MSQFMNLEEGTSGQLPTGHQNGINTEVSGHIQNYGVEVQGISSSSSTGRESTSSGRSQFVNLEEGTSEQLPMGHRNGTNTEVLGHIKNYSVEVQGISISSSIGRESTSSRRSRFVNLEEGTSGQLPTGHRNGTNTEVSGHIQNSGDEVQGISSSSSTDRESTRPFCRKVFLQFVNISPYIWCANTISIEPFLVYDTVINYDRKCIETDITIDNVGKYLIPFNILIIIGTFLFLTREVKRRVGLARPMEWREGLLKNFLARAMKWMVGLLKIKLLSIIWFSLLLDDFFSNIPCIVGGGLWTIIASWLGYNGFDATSLYLLQYFLRVIILYTIFIRDTKTWATLARATWVKAAFNLLLYIHGGHVI